MQSAEITDKQINSSHPVEHLLIDVLDLVRAAKLLYLNPESLRRLAKKGEVPGRKVGRKWLFSHRALLTFIETAEVTESKTCPSTSVGKLGGYASQTQAAKEYKSLLGLQTK